MIFLHIFNILLAYGYLDRKAGLYQDEMFRRFLEHQESAASRSPLLSHLILMEILCMIADSNIMPANDGPSAVLASRADSYIRTHFHQNLSTIKLAEALGCNPDYLGRIYRRVYRKTLTETIHEFRIKYACQLLMDSNLNIEEVARTSGFDDSGYFRRIFKRLKGLSPTQYRHLYTLVHINT